MSAAPPIMMRVAITRDEWVELQKLCLDLNTRAPLLLAELVRARLSESPATDRRDNG